MRTFPLKAEELQGKEKGDTEEIVRNEGESGGKVVMVVAGMDGNGGVSGDDKMGIVELVLFKRSGCDEGGSGDDMEWSKRRADKEEKKRSS